MPRFETFKGVLAFWGSSILAALGIFGIVQLGVAEMIVGEPWANAHLYPTLSIIFQLMAYVALVIFAILFIWAPISYVRNRGKPKTKSQELLVIESLQRDLEQKLDIIIKLLKTREDRTGDE